MCYSALVLRDIEHLGRRFGATPVREQIDDYVRASQADPKRFPALAERIFPGSYAPVLFEQKGKRVIEVMRYGSYPAIEVKAPSKYSSFNARRDNLHSPFWSNAFMRHHGFIVLEGFFEWVAVKDLLKAGVVTRKDVEAEFHRQAEERKAKILAQGKKYKPTPTEIKDAALRQIIIQFQPRERGTELLVPVIFSEKKLPDGRLDKGFAIVTDEPLPDVQAAGHDRSPVILPEAAIDGWLRPEQASAEAMDRILAGAELPHFDHRLPEAS